MVVLKNILLNKNGFSYVLICIIIIIAMMLVFIALQYAFVYHTIREQKNEFQLKLDSYITKCAMKEYDVLKQGDAWPDYMDWDEVVSGAYDTLGFVNSDNGKYIERENYSISYPSISTLEGDQFGVSVQYEISIPFEAFENKIADIIVPVEIVSRYAER